MTTSATPRATDDVAARRSASDTRATDPMPNQWFAGFSRVHQCSATSASGAPNGRPMTAVAVWYTGSPPGRAAGNRTRSRCSFPIDPDTCVRNSTRSAAVPQQRLRGHRQVAERVRGDEPRPDGRALRPHGRLAR